MAEEKNAKNSAGAGDENTKNYVSRCIGVFLGEESEFPIRFVISLMVSEILANYCSKGQKDVLFPRGCQGTLKNYVSRFIGVFLGQDFEFPIRFVISFTVSEILAIFAQKGRKMYFFLRGCQWRLKNYVSRLIGVFLGEKSEFPIRFVISFTVSLIFAQKGRKMTFFPGDANKDGKIM